MRPDSRPAYRPDIDGLRALAVGAVILYHARAPWVGGGYIGVDVFFVISGYLITRLLLASADTPLRAQLTRFYLRRGRRILPALFVTALVVAGAASAILLPWDLERLGRYVAATALFLSNVPPWLAGNSYFDATLAPVALTHLWSIAVEEQFYLVYPLALYLAGRYLPGHRFVAFASIAAASFALCVWASYARVIANFFLAPTRAWEFLLGALLVMRATPSWEHRLSRELLAAGALLTLLFVSYAYTPTTRYPGVFTVAPCAATAVLLAMGARQPLTVTHRLLSLRPLVFTGLVSYSLYLWHEPILVLARYYNIVSLGMRGTGVLLVCIYLVGVLSWRYLEKPIRSGNLLRSDRNFTLGAVAAGAAVLATGLLLWQSHGLAWLYPASFRMPEMEWAPHRDAILKCVSRPAATISAGGLCSYGPQRETVPKALVWGDSHAMVTLPAYEKLAAQLQVRIYFAAKAACRPLLGVTNRLDEPDRQVACADFNAAVVRAIERLQPDVVILNAHWIDANADLTPGPGSVAQPGVPHFEAGMEQMLAAIHAQGREVCAVLDVPIFPYNVPNAVSVARKRGIPEDFMRVSRAQALAQYQEPESTFRRLQERGLLRTVDLKDRLCPAGFCAYEADGTLLYADEHHLSTHGALYVTSVLERCLRDISAPGH
jgi:peptidoglycan/LPS O-acetylase OafA/YrhL